MVLFFLAIGEKYTVHFCFRSLRWLLRSLPPILQFSINLKFVLVNTSFIYLEEVHHIAEAGLTYFDLYCFARVHTYPILNRNFPAFRVRGIERQQCGMGRPLRGPGTTLQ